MKFSRLRIQPRLTVLSALALIAAGCTQQSEFQAPVSQFRDASAVVIQSAKLSLRSLNKNERDAYIYRQMASRGQIKPDDIKNVQGFSPTSIALRTKALDEISNYTELLYQLANSDAPASISGKADDLSKSLTTLADEVNTLGGPEDTKFKGAVSATAPLLSAIVKSIINKKITEALKDAVNRGTQPVNNLIEAIRLDLDVAYERKLTAVQDKLDAAVRNYNREFAKGDAADSVALLEYADRVSVAEDQVETLRAAPPDAGLDAMKKANGALLALANQPKPSVHDFATFVAEVQSFANTAKQVGDAVQALEKL